MKVEGKWKPMSSPLFPSLSFFLPLSLEVSLPPPFKHPLRRLWTREKLLKSSVRVSARIETNSQRGRVLSKKATKQFTKYKNASCQQKFTQALAARSEDKLDELLADKRNATPPPRLSSEICCYQILEFMSCGIRRNYWMKRRKREMELRNIKSLRYV